MTHPRLLDKYFVFRYKVDKPIVITSGYRCWNHHVQVYKNIYGNAWAKHITKKSKHLEGIALDMKTPEGMTDKEFMDEARDVGFTYVYNIKSGYIHVDVR